MVERYGQKKLSDVRVYPRVSWATFRFLRGPWRQETVTVEPIKGHFETHKYHKARWGRYA